jgi:hypothetical protein
LRADGHPTGEQRADGLRGRIGTGPARTPLMIIERIQQQLITRVRRGQAERPSDGEAEQHGHLIVDHGTAHRIDLRRRQHVQQS